MDIANVRWAGHRQFVGTDASGHSVVMDSKPEQKGEGSGIRPIELVLQGLAGCTGMDVISILEKKREDVRGVEINVRGVQREDVYPHIYTDIEVEYVVTGFGIKPASVARAIELSAEKYCAVKGMFGPEVEVKTSFRVVEARGAGEPLLAGDPVHE